jgi:hypothetical protein
MAIFVSFDPACTSLLKAAIDHRWNGRVQNTVYPNYSITTTRRALTTKFMPLATQTTKQATELFLHLHLAYAYGEELPGQGCL